uniref:Uncharacterized protein n=1 Tax=Echeneis naucrates TaxID=173247 RepID=A0A665W2N2_ECHNA
MVRALESTGFSKKFTNACSVSSDPPRPPPALSEATCAGCAPFSSSWPVTSDPEPCPPRWPASPICSTRLVTVAMAWKRSVLQNWMNSHCRGRDEAVYNSTSNTFYQFIFFFIYIN